MTITPALMALLDKITDPTQQALDDLRIAIDDLSTQIATLKTATDKDGDCKDYLWSLAHEADTAFDQLADLIEENR